MQNKGKSNTEKYKVSLREILKDLNKCRDVLYSWIIIFNGVKKSILPKLVYSLTELVKITKGIFLEICQQNKTHWYLL